MNILLFGVSNVGKTSIGRFLAKKLDFDFFDLDEEVKRRMDISLEEFVHLGNLQYRDKIRCSIIRSLLKDENNKVIAVTPLSYLEEIKPLLISDSAFSIELRDSVEHIFERLVFSDENDCIYKDDEYKNAHAEYYLNDIAEDLKWYGEIYGFLKYRFDIDGRSIQEAADALIDKFHLIN